MEKIKLPLKIPEYLSHFENKEKYVDFFLKQKNLLLMNLGMFVNIDTKTMKDSADTLYKLVYKPDNAKLFKDTAGNIKGVFYKNGKILEHAKFKEVQIEQTTTNVQNVGSAISSMYTQALLLKISMDIEEIFDEISGLKKELSNDRLSKLKTGIIQCDHAILARDEGNRKSMLTNAIQTLEEGIEKNLCYLKSKIYSAPNDEITFFTNWGSKGKSKKAKEIFHEVNEIFKTLLRGMRKLAESYSFLNEPELASKILRENIEKLDDGLIKTAIDKARLVPAENEKYAEEIWNSFLDIKPNILECISDCHEFSQNKFESIEIEIKPSDLKELNA